MNLSHWSDYDAEQRARMLSEIGSVVRNHVMPPQRYLLLHPEARLDGSEAEQIYQWTKTERMRPEGAHASACNVCRQTGRSRVILLFGASPIHPIVYRE